MAQAAQICGAVNEPPFADFKAPPTGGPVIDAKLMMAKAMPILVPTLSSRSVMLATVVGVKHWKAAENAP